MKRTLNETQRTTAMRSRGFTLVEMMAVLCIFCILVTIAAPSYSSLIAGQRASATATDVYVALANARSEAIKRNSNTTLANKSGGWQAGWQATVIDSSNNTVVIDDHPATTGITLTGPDSIVYQSSGRVNANAAPCFAIVATQGSSVEYRWVAVDLSGRPLVKTSSCS
jgi:type IV fimbrial biogenesis protein FimT